MTYFYQCQTKRKRFYKREPKNTNFLISEKSSHCSVRNSKITKAKSTTSSFLPSSTCSCPKRFFSYILTRFSFNIFSRFSLLCSSRFSLNSFPRFSLFCFPRFSFHSLLRFSLHSLPRFSLFSFTRCAPYSCS